MFHREFSRLMRPGSLLDCSSQQQPEMSRNGKRQSKGRHRRNGRGRGFWRVGGSMRRRADVVLAPGVGAVTKNAF
eukprot:7528912-Pyramimonas_sp.AAC.1